MTRQIIQIDEEKCNGCGVCATACHEGAIEIVDGKARLMRDDFCDGFGDCLPGCPVGAITFIQKDTLAYDEAAVEENKRQKAQAAGVPPSSAHESQHHHEASHAGGGCPGSAVQTFDRGSDNGDAVDAQKEARQARLKEIMAKMPASSGCPGKQLASFDRADSGTQDAQAAPTHVRSELRQWPCQIKLVPPKAPFFQGAKLLVAADCTAYAYAGFHAEFMRGKITLIGCPKLDAVDYTEKLTQIIALNDIKELLVLRMEVPCCGGLENACVNALKASGKFIPWRVVTISTDGRILE